VVEFRYNALNQLTLFIDAENRRTSYTYAPNGFRNSKATLDISGSWIASITRYYWDRGFIANETINGAHSATNFIGVGGIFGRRNFGPNGCNEQFMMLKNWRGDVVSLVNEDGLLWRYDYSAFGVERKVPGFGAERAKPNNPWRFNGEYLCSASGLVYLRNRWYEPRTGRFTQEDPYWNLGNMQDGIWSIRQSSNLFAFGMNNPIRWIDPSGLSADDPSHADAIIPNAWVHTLGPYARFSSTTEAATDWGRNTFATSNFIGREQAAIIFRMSSSNGYFYSYTYSVEGTTIGVPSPDALVHLPGWDIYNMPQMLTGTWEYGDYTVTVVGLAHSHPNYIGRYNEETGSYSFDPRVLSYDDIANVYSDHGFRAILNMTYAIVPSAGADAGNFQTDVMFDVLRYDSNAPAGSRENWMRANVLYNPLTVARENQIVRNMAERGLPIRNN